MLPYEFVALIYFNSIKVQLEPKRVISSKQGTQFQFHKGTIRTCFDLRAAACVFYFNSIKVQLERQFDALVDFVFNLFQFHKGTIRTTDFHLLDQDLRHFNSIKVQLERRTSMA